MGLLKHIDNISSFLPFSIIGLDSLFVNNVLYLNKKEKIDHWIRVLPHKLLSYYYNIRFYSPYLEHNIKNEFIFVHIPKNAGIFIQKYLFPDKPRTGHHPITQFKYTDRDKFKMFYKFAFVRNPWDRLVSTYYFVKQGGENNSERAIIEWSQKYLTYIDSFEKFIYKLKSMNFANKVLSFKHFIPQYKWIYDERNCLVMDFVGKVEKLKNDLEIIQQKLGFKRPIKLEKENKSIHKPYRELYNSKMKKIVSKLYEKDIKLFNYTFTS